MVEAHPPTDSTESERQVAVASLSAMRERRLSSAEPASDSPPLGLPSAAQNEALRGTLWGGHLELVFPGATEVHDSVHDLVRHELRGWKPGVYDEGNRLFASVALPDGGAASHDLVERAADHLAVVLPGCQVVRTSVEHADDPIPGESTYAQVCLRVRPALTLIETESGAAE